MANIEVDFNNKIIKCDCGHKTHMSEPDIFGFCPDCGEYHLACFGCERSIQLPWIMQDYIRTYRETLIRKTERIN